MASNARTGCALRRARQGAVAGRGGRRTRALRLAAFVLLHAMISAGLFSTGLAAEGAAGSEAPAGLGLFADKDTPVVITADSMELRRNTNTIIYKGNVLVERDDVRITSDVLSARYDAGDGGLRSVVAEGKVRVRHGGREMTGDKAVFDGVKETITVSGNTTVREGNSSISGDRITIYMKEDRSVVENSEGRVRAVIFPGQLNR